MVDACCSLTLRLIAALSGGYSSHQSMIGVMTSADAPPHPPVGLKGNSHTNWVGFPPISVGVDGYLAGWPIMWLKQCQHGCHGQQGLENRGELNRGRPSNALSCRLTALSRLSSHQIGQWDSQPTLQIPCHSNQ